MWTFNELISINFLNFSLSDKENTESNINK